MQQNELFKAMLCQRTRLTGYAWSIVRDLDLAEDIVQDVFVIAIQKSDAINDNDHLDLWLRKSIRFQALASLRKKSGNVLLDEELLGLIDSAFGGQALAPRADERLDALAGCLEELAPKARAVIEMRYGRGLDCGSIAEHFDRQIETVYQMVARAHRTLRECVQRKILPTGV